MTPRTYSQDARARSTEQTRRAILDAAVALFYAGDYEIALDRVATAAGVSARTILRHFGSKEGLIEAASADQASAIEAERDAPPGNPAAFVASLVDHYERLGDDVLRMLAAEERYPLVRQIADNGRRHHAELVASAFAPDLDGLGDAARATRAALLETVTDVYTWALLRRRGGLGREATEGAILGLVNHARGANP